VALLRNHRRVLLLSALGAAILALLAIVALDGPLTVTLSSLAPDIRERIQNFVRTCEVIFAFGISRYLYGFVLVVAGLAALPIRKTSLLPWALLFVGLSHVTARLAAGILKVPFSRLRPFEALGANGWHDTWFAAVGNSFPSGHAVHFWSLFFPLAVLFPRFRIVLVILPVLVSAARIVVNDHYTSDILASVAIAAFATWVYDVAVLERGAKRVFRTAGSAVGSTSVRRAG
jgi:membrane-associated phospholipid phosphatase